MGKDTQTYKHTVMIIMPAYNEAARICDVIATIPETLKVGKRTFDVGIIVIEDGSADDTFTQALKTRAIVLRHIMNSGAGAATRTGLRYVEQHLSDVAYAITIDADGQHDTADIARLIVFAEKNHADMVVGNRLHAGNKADMPFYRQLGNQGLSLISRVLFNIKTEDTQSGLRLFSSRAIPIVSKYTIDRYGFCTEMLWHAIRAGLVVQEMPISVRYSAETLANGQSNWGVIDLVRDLVWIRISS